MPDGTITAILQGFRRLSVDGVLGYDPYITARVHYLEDYLADVNSVDVKMIADSLKEKASNIIKSSNFAPKEAVNALRGLVYRIKI